MLTCPVLKFLLGMHGFLLEFWGSMGGIYCDSPEEYPEESQRFLTIAHKLWAPTLKRLRASRPKAKERRKEAIAMWEEFGKVLDFREASFNARDLPPGHIRGCQWSECWCHDKKPSHSMNVCKGCWRVLYCSTKCQRR